MPSSAGQRRLRSIARLSLGILAAFAPLRAERYAVLVGVGKYLHVKGLDGPAYDVEAVKNSLIANGYSPAAIKVLLNEQGTRPKIVDALSQTVGQMKAGDHLIFYFSGHGTSAFDRNMQFLSPEIGPDSGGLATYDLSLASLPAAVDTLVIGQRDLRPILSRVPSGAQALVVLDACYSENSAKSVSVFQGAPVRGINLVDALPAPASTTPKQALASAPSPAGPYPYRNVVSLSAASKEQPALDITLATMRSKPEWRTVDGKPHGALTNSLLDALSGRGDTNRDGAMTYDEMFRYVRRQMERFPHQPQLLTDRGFSLDQPALGAGKAVTATEPPMAPNAASRFRVNPEVTDLVLLAQLAQLTEIQLGIERYDLLIRPAEDLLGLYDPSGVLIQRIPPGDRNAIVARVRAQAKVWELRSWQNPNQKYNVRIDAEPVDGEGYDKLRTIFRVGEKVRFRLSTEKPAFLLLIGLDKNGEATVLFPGPAANDRQKQPANKAIEFVVEAEAPAGSEHLKLIGFESAPPDWDQWACSSKACPKFNAADPQMAKLINMLRSSSGTAESSLRLITQQ